MTSCDEGDSSHPIAIPLILKTRNFDEDSRKQSQPDLRQTLCVISNNGCNYLPD